MKISFMMTDPVTDLAELDRRMELLAALGYRGVELVGTSPPGTEVDDLVALTRKHQLPVVALLSGWSYGHEGLCLCSPEASVRDRAVGRIEDYVRTAAKLQAVVVVGLMQGLRSDEPDEAKAAERIADGLKRVAATAESLAASVALEPVNHFQVGFNHTAEEAEAMAAWVGSPALGIMLDTLHMNIEERSILETIRTQGARLRHFHLCETNGGPFGTGGLDFPSVLATLRDTGYDHFVSAKVYRHAAWAESAQASAEFLRGCGVAFR